jgi:pilus assembly protein CpaF
LVIRKFPKKTFTMENLLELESFSPEIADFLKSIVKKPYNIIVAGGAGSGKTTVLNVLANLVGENERVISVLDGEELRLTGKRVIPLYAQPASANQEAVTVRMLVQQALKMRPDRIILGELRNGEALELISAMNSGHDGCMSSMHANSVRDCLSRLETLYSLAIPSVPLLTVREQIATAIHFIIHQQQLSDGVRRILAIAEVTGIEGGSIQTQDLFVYEQTDTAENGKIQGNFRATGYKSKNLN